MLIVGEEEEKMAQYIRRHGQEGKGNVTIEEFAAIVEEEIKKTLKVQFNLNYKVIAIRSNRVTNLA
jgi:threonyl-tRNA synthetase